MCPMNGRRVVSLNIQHGGRTKDGVDALVARLLSYDADVLVVTEFMTEYLGNKVGERLVGQLVDRGYGTSHPDAGKDQRSVLVASRDTIQRSWAFSQELSDSRRLWCADLGWAVMCGVYMPQYKAKLPYWRELIDHGHASGVDLIVGDFNTGTNDLDKHPQGARFDGAEMPGRLIETGYVDIWRSRNPGVREYTYHDSKTNYGFRIDTAFATADLAKRVTACEYDQTPRIRRETDNRRETDHAALVVSFDRRSHEGEVR
jgi:exodeoxyribonuclease III